MIRKILGVAAATALVTGCGNTNAPLSIINTGESTLPELGLPVSITNTGGYFGNGTNLRSAQTFTFVLGVSFVGSSITPIAPAAGTVVQQDGTTVTIMHNARLTTRISNISALTIRLGDYIAKGAQLSTQQFATYTGQSAPGFNFQVLLDGQVVCPWSFFSTEVRQQLITISQGGIGYFTSGVCTE